MASANSQPPIGAFTAAERRLIQRLRTPALVQRYLNTLPYNTEPPPERAKLRSFRGVLQHRTAHCLEAALAAAVILEQHGFPPRLLSFESIDDLDHVIYIYQRNGRFYDAAYPSVEVVRRSAWIAQTQAAMRRGGLANPFPTGPKGWAEPRKDRR